MLIPRPVHSKRMASFSWKNDLTSTICSTKASFVPAVMGYFSRIELDVPDKRNCIYYFIFNEP